VTKTYVGDARSTRIIERYVRERERGDGNRGGWQQGGFPDREPEYRTMNEVVNRSPPSRDQLLESGKRRQSQGDTYDRDNNET
jgi:hypothetical protein